MSTVLHWQAREKRERAKAEAMAAAIRVEQKDKPMEEWGMAASYEFLVNQVGLPEVAEQISEMPNVKMNGKTVKLLLSDNPKEAHSVWTKLAAYQAGQVGGSDTQRTRPSSAASISLPLPSSSGDSRAPDVGVTSLNFGI